MCLLERALSWDPQQIVATTTTHRDPTHPLRGASGLRAVHLCEYGAQAAALHGGLAARAAGGRAPPGMIVSLRDVSLGRAFIHDLPGELTVTARLLLAGDSGTQYSFEVVNQWEVIASGRVAIMQRES
jgi:predicted hotdog family 3-hydroxylacyl-ACP dehydratase